MLYLYDPRNSQLHSLRSNSHSTSIKPKQKTQEHVNSSTPHIFSESHLLWAPLGPAPSQIEKASGQTHRTKDQQTLPALAQGRHVSHRITDQRTQEHVTSRNKPRIPKGFSIPELSDFVLFFPFQNARTTMRSRTQYSHPPFILISFPQQTLVYLQGSTMVYNGLQ